MLCYTLPVLLGFVLENTRDLSMRMSSTMRLVNQYFVSTSSRVRPSLRIVRNTSTQVCLPWAIDLQISLWRRSNHNTRHNFAGSTRAQKSPVRLYDPYLASVYHTFFWFRCQILHPRIRCLHEPTVNARVRCLPVSGEAHRICKIRMAHTNRR